MPTESDVAQSTREQILNVAEQRLVRLGFNGFSYGDVAHELGLTTASIHYHFPAKADLGVALIERYSSNLERACAAIVATKTDSGAQMKAYVKMFDVAAQKGELLTCCVLAAEYATLPKTMQDRLRALFDGNKQWLIGVIERGVAAGSFAVRHKPAELADAAASALHGALVVARANGGITMFRTSVALLLQGLTQPLAG